jgi:PAS domain S-box-containing protein
MTRDDASGSAEQERYDLQDILRLVSGETAGIEIVDARQRITHWSEGAAALLGYAPGEAAGCYCDEVIAGTDADGNPFCKRDCEVMERLRAGQPVSSYDVVGRHKDGSLRPINITIVVVKPSDFEDPLSLRLLRPADQRDPAVVEQETPAPEPPEGRGAALAREGRPPLSPRELEVLRLLAAGNGVKEIADELVVSQTTVRNHIGNILGKLGVHTRLQAVIHAAQVGLL